MVGTHARDAPMSGNCLPLNGEAMEKEPKLMDCANCARRDDCPARDLIPVEKQLWETCDSFEEVLLEWPSGET